MADRIKLKCGCGKILIATEKLAGKILPCPQCGESIAIPSHDESPQEVRTYPGPIAEERQIPVGDADELIRKTQPRRMQVPNQGTVSIILLAMILAALIVPMILTNSSTVPEWEYQITAPSDLLFETEINTLGRQGWELVFARRATGSKGENSVNYEMIFKRQIRKTK